MAVTEGQLISDGTAVWKVKRIDSVEVPVGASIEWTADTIPDGWLLCDGSAVSRTLYAKLFAVIGTKWGEGDGSTTFNLPNSIGRFAEGSTTSGSYKSAGLPNIVGSYSGQIFGNYANGTGQGAFTANSTNSTTGFARDSGSTAGFNYGFSFSAQKSNSIYGASTTVQPNSYTVKKIIKY